MAGPLGALALAAEAELHSGAKSHTVAAAALR
jgi:hypothetical protein